MQLKDNWQATCRTEEDASNLKESLYATVMVPTTAGRAPVLPFSIGSILSQTVRDFELFIMGDGVDDETRSLIHDLMRHDARIRFFDHPKHERRGEPHRHAALAQARGKFICYLCDRDLMLPHHLETLEHLLRDSDFAHTLIFRVTPTDEFEFFTLVDLANPQDRNWIVRGFNPENGIPLSFVGHSAAMYRSLPFGWRTTPPDRYTDVFMWEQFLGEQRCRARSGQTPSILYFPSFQRNGWTVEQKLEEITRWAARLPDPGWLPRMMQLVIDGLARDRLLKARQVRAMAGSAQALLNQFKEILASGK